MYTYGLFIELTGQVLYSHDKNVELQCKVNFEMNHCSRRKRLATGVG